MCLAIPARVTTILDGERAKIDVGGVQKEISLALVEGIEVGDYVIVHVGYALDRVHAAEAERTLEMLRAAGMVPAGTAAA